MNLLRPIAVCLSTMFVCVGVTFAQSPPSSDAKPVDTTPPEPAWVDRLDKTDRAILDEALGYAPPAIPNDIKWVGGSAVNWNGLRGKVVVMQSFTTANTAGRSWPARVHKALDDFSANDVVVLAVHTPDGADEAPEFLSRKPAEMTVIVDSNGAFCDELGFYKRPTNLVIDRNGAVRYAGLNERGLKGAVKLLVAEKFDLAKTPPARSGDSVEDNKSPSKADFPKPDGPVGSAKDLRGQRAPEFYVQQWITPQPASTEKPVVIDFWATWCGPCIASIPHMNDMAAKFGDRAVFVGLSDEKENDFFEGLKKRKLKVEGFKYNLALDPTNRMASATQIRGIPHVMVISSDWVVRWQGHPTVLNEMVLERIIKADESMRASSLDNSKPDKKGTSPNRYRWTKA